MNIELIEALAGIALIFILAYFCLTKNFDFWKKRGVAGPKPIPLFGNLKDVMLMRVHMADYMKSLHDNYPDEPVIGFFFSRTPGLLLKDPEVIKDVLIKNFSTFMDRGLNIYADIDPLSQHLVLLEPKRWKPLRKRLTLTFSSGKLKEMFYLINECADNFQKYLLKLAEKNETIDCGDVTAKFTTDVIGMCAFGLNANALEDEDSEFRRIGKKLFENNFKNTLRRLLRKIPHWMARLMKPFIYDKNIISFFTAIVKQNMEYRKINGIRKNDFIDLLMDIKNDPREIGEEEMTDMFMTAQVYVFFVAGFESSSNTMSHVLYELAKNPDIQNKLREEIHMILERNDGRLNYDCLKDMKYLDKVVKETLRKYPPGFVLSRKSMENHTFQHNNLSIPAGTNIFISVYAIHHDPKIYPDPDKFDPERFSEEIASLRPPMSYLSFGDGPRNCIGERFANNQTKVGLVTALRHCKFKISEKMSKTYVKDKKALLLSPSGGIHLRIKKL